MRTTAVLSVIFPANRVFFNEYLQSLTQQTENDFDVLLLVDQVPDIMDYISTFRDQLTFHIRHVTGSIASIRTQAITWALSLNYRFFVFADTDDLLAPSRVALCRQHLELFPVVVNDLLPFSEKQSARDGFWKNRLIDGYEFTAADIEDFNFAGLGNTAIRKEVLQNIPIPEKLRAVDWFIYYQWMQRNTGVFIHGGQVLYRQHEANLAGLHKVDAKRLENIFNVKQTHYESLLPLFPHLYKKLEIVERRRTAMQDSMQMKKTIDQLNTATINYFWWEETDYIKI
jgi:hypothetical protein